MDSQQMQARIEALESNQARIDASLSGAIQGTNGLHEAVQVVSSVDVPVQSGLILVDGVIMPEGGRAYLANQNVGTTGGLWIAHAGVWTRPSDWQDGQVIAVGEQITVAQGSGFQRFGSRWIVITGGVVGVANIIAFPAHDKGTGVLDLTLADRWIITGAEATANDTTVGAVAACNVTACTQGGANFGRGTGTLTIDGTAPHVVGFVIVNL